MICKAKEWLKLKGLFQIQNQSAKKEGIFGSNNEPISVLDTRRSPSPSTSTSTLSSSFGGGGAGSGGGGSSTDNTARVGLGAISVPAELGSTGSVTNPCAGGGGARKDEWAAELEPIIPAGLGVVGQSQRFGVGLDDWESLLSESAASPGQDQDQNLLRWISGDVEDTSFSLKQLLQGAGNPSQIYENAPLSSIFETSQAVSNVVSNLNPSPPFPATEKIVSCPNFNPQNPNFLPQVFNPQMVISPPQIQTNSTHNMFLDPRFQHPQPKRHNPAFPKAPFQDPGQEFSRKQQKLPPPGLVSNFQQQNKPLRVVAKQEPVAACDEQQQVLAPPPHHPHNQQQFICDQLYSAAELILAGNFQHAQGILARLNHQLSATTIMANKPFHRAGFYFKEALQLPLLVPDPLNSRIPTLLNGMFKMGAYKFLSEVSPIVQFMNFTSNQTLLEALEDADRIHIIDFDIGFGAQWASFLQELPRKNNNGGGGGNSCSSLKITAFASPTTHHPIEIALMHENLSQFAHELGVSFELEVVNFDSFDPNSFLVSGNEAIAVNFPLWCSSAHLAAIPTLLLFIKQLSPRIVVSLDRGCERTDLPFSQYLLHGLQYYEVLLDSIDAANVTSDTSNKIERFLFQPRIESLVMGRFHVPDPIPHWRTLFGSAGYSPVALSNFAEAQAECVVKRTQVRGFHVERKQGSLVLCWQHRELMTASAWKC